MPVTIETAAPEAKRSLQRAVWNGLRCRCPNCGEGRLFAGYTAVVPRCAACGEDLSHQQADDAPPYIVIFLVGHIVVALALWTEKAFHPDLWVHMALWIPMTLLLSLLLLPPMKGVIVGVQWANRMHGFGGTEDA